MQWPAQPSLGPSCDLTCSNVGRLTAEASRKYRPENITHTTENIYTSERRAVRVHGRALRGEGRHGRVRDVRSPVRRPAPRHHHHHPAQLRVPGVLLPALQPPVRPRRSQGPGLSHRHHRQW